MLLHVRAARTTYLKISPLDSKNLQKGSFSTRCKRCAERKNGGMGCIPSFVVAWCLGGLSFTLGMACDETNACSESNWIGLRPELRDGFAVPSLSSFVFTEGLFKSWRRANFHTDLLSIGL